MFLIVYGLRLGSVRTRSNATVPKRTPDPCSLVRTSRICPHVSHVLSHMIDTEGLDCTSTAGSLIKTTTFLIIHLSFQFSTV